MQFSRVKKMASLSLRFTLFFTATFLILCIFTEATPHHPEFILTLVNNCPFTVWPAIQPNSGHAVLERGGFALNTLTHHSFPAPAQHWSGRIWARTGCSYNHGHFSCATGDCGGRLECNGLGGSSPATLAQFSLHHGHNDLSSYAVSLVDGFNVPMTVTPHEGKGLCPVVGCRANLLATCPDRLQLRSPPGHGPVVACKSGCEAFGTDELCCRNHYNSPQTCRASSFSEFFKHACPATFTYAHDSPSLMHECSSPRELKIIFCH
ncbi:osmotin-like protein [Juglans microcarpa x Juglans regia]|uniref:osmotin-like protein n=1 Tax=Juglans microcarpa x Juglans regia TaxID=2249226 RepID=UPI001B7E8F3A|nr:osmotin-like protein [Juglans microcarpa x Juglans regia]